MKTYVSNSLEDTAKIATEWLKSLENNFTAKAEAAVVALSGHLGAGKTAFVKQVAKELGIGEEVTSPTFVIMKIYEAKHEKWHCLVHIDAYRLERREELEVLNWEKLVADPHNLIMVEWPEQVGLKDFDGSCYLKFDIKEGKHFIAIE